MTCPPRQVHATHPCPRCKGVLLLRRCKTAHRQRLCCDCGYSEALPLAMRLRRMGYPELPLFDSEEAMTHDNQ